MSLLTLLQTFGPQLQLGTAVFGSVLTVAPFLFAQLESNGEQLGQACYSCYYRPS
jgi:hypothetical protein